MNELEMIKQLEALGIKGQWIPDYGAPMWCGQVVLGGKIYNIQLQEDLEGDK